MRRTPKPRSRTFIVMVFTAITINSAHAEELPLLRYIDQLRYGAYTPATATPDTLWAEAERAVESVVQEACVKQRQPDGAAHIDNPDRCAWAVAMGIDLIADVPGLRGYHVQLIKFSTFYEIPLFKYRIK